MNEKYLEKLEFNKIIEILKTYAVTYLGKNMVSSLQPSSNLDEVNLWLSQTTDAYKLLYKKSNPPLFELPDMTVCLKAIASSQTLSTTYLLDLANLLKLARNLKDFFESDNEFENIAMYFNNLYSNIGTENKIFSCVLDENTIDDKASTTLASIRRNIRKAEADIRTKLNSFMNSKYIQEPVVTIRAGRFVIPIKQEYRTNVKGFVHDISASGSTVFIEPMVVFELNNTLNSLKAEENIEIEKILQILSSLFFGIVEELENNLSLIANIDFLFAKAKYARDTNSIEPIINTNKQINLIQARHPLIDKISVVPIDIHIGTNFTSLIITGPNTGGKTVSLKTVGLLCSMASSRIIYSCI